MDDTKSEYKKAYEAWTGQLAELHAFLLEGERLQPVKIKGLLNREARAKEKYDEARKRLLGLSD
jgi:hypothetical protein